MSKDLVVIKDFSYQDKQNPEQEKIGITFVVRSLSLNRNGESLHVLHFPFDYYTFDYKDIRNNTDYNKVLEIPFG